VKVIVIGPAAPAGLAAGWAEIDCDVVADAIETRFDNSTETWAGVPVTRRGQ